MPRKRPQSSCPICLHEYELREMNKHHLIPKSRKGTVTVMLCRLCHRQIHALFTEKELEQKHHTITALLGAERMQSWIRWIRRRKPTRHIAVKTSQVKRR